MFIVLAVFMIFAITDRQSFAADVELSQPLSEEEITEIRSDTEVMKTTEVLFLHSCAYCHGVRGVGGKARKMQCLTLLKPDYVFNVISNGKKGQFIMPSWKASFDKKTRLQLTAYIMSLTDLPQCKK